MLNIANFLDKFKVLIGVGLVGIVLMIGGLVSTNLTKKSSAELPSASKVYGMTVDVSGAVINPGVYNLESEARVEDAIKAAGGLAEQANGEYISKSLNLAQKLSDGMKIYIPYQGETNVPSISGVASKANAMVGINTATQAELEALPGIGPVTAAKIISGRPYGKINDLLDQKIVSKAVFEKIKESLAI